MKDYRLLEHIVLEHQDLKIRNSVNGEEVYPKIRINPHLMMVF